MLDGAVPKLQFWETGFACPAAFKKRSFVELLVRRL
jgi:hypothetical protein